MFRSENGLDQKGHMVRCEPRVRSIKRERIRFFSQKYLPNFVGGNVREREREGGKKEIQASLFYSRSSVGRKSSG